MTHPKLAVETPHGRKYVHPLTSEEWYSVTTVLGNGIPIPALVPWAARMAAQCSWEIMSRPLTEWTEERFVDYVSTAYERYTQECADVGDEAHNSADAYLNGNPDGNSVGHMRQLQSFLDTSGYTPLYSEVTLLNRDPGYAGTADLIACAPSGEVVLVDYKTGKAVREKDMLQVEALARAKVILHEDGKESDPPPVSSVGILHLRPRSWWFHHNTNPVARNRNWDAFLGAMLVADWRRLHPDMVFGGKPRMNQGNWAA